MTQPGPRKTELLAAARDAVAAEAAKRDAERTQEARNAARRKPKWLVPLLGVTSIVLLVLLIVKPEWLIGSRRTPKEPPAVTAANARSALVVIAARLTAYRTANGRLPVSLDQLPGVDTAGVQYIRNSDDRYRLQTTRAPIVTLSSDDDPYAVLKGQLETLRRRPQ